MFKKGMFGKHEREIKIADNPCEGLRKGLGKENIFRKLATYAPFGIIVVNASQSLEYINPKFKKISGYSLKDIPNSKAWFEKAYPDKKDRSRAFLAWKQHLLDEARPGSINEEATTIRRKDGKEISLHIRTVALEDGGRMLLFDDITGRVRPEMLMLDGWNIYRNLVETVLDWTWEIKENGTFTYSSPQVKNVIGYTPGEVVGRKFCDFLPEKEAKRVRSLMSRNAVSGKPFLSFEVICRKKNGDTAELETSGTPLFDRKGNLIGCRGITRDISQRKALEAELKSSHEKLRALTAKLQDVREDERTSISRELHDELGQVLTGLKIDLTWIAKRLTPGQVQLFGKVQGMRSQIDSAIEYIRRISSELRPKLLDDFGLVEAIDWLVQDFRDRTSIRCRLNTNISHLNISPRASTIIFRIIQETLTNIMRHSNASSAVVSIKRTRKELVISIRDNGRGITRQEISDKKSLGLLGMKERAAILDGKIKLEGAPGKGTGISVYIPLVSIIAEGPSAGFYPQTITSRQSAMVTPQNPKCLTE